MNLEVSEPAINGLQLLFGSISNDVSKKVIFNCVKQALTTKPNIPFKAEHYSSCPDLIKQAEYSILVLYFQATKKGASINDIRNYLTQQNVKNEAIEELVGVYSLHRDEFVQKALEFSPSYLPFVNDVSWSLQCDVNSSSLSKAGEINYKIQLEGKKSNASNQEVITEFTCSPEELQALINRLKEIERNCEKIASNKF